MNDTAGAWGRSGLAWLTGAPDGPPDFSRSGVLARAEAVAVGIGERLGVRVDAATTLSGRAALAGLRPRGRISAGGATRLLPTRDGWCALTLSRPDDVAAVPALLESDADTGDPWPAVADWAAVRSCSAVVGRGVLLDLPVAALGEATAEPPRVTVTGPRCPPRAVTGLLVADLSSMWAGPLCGGLLAAAGATVVKVENPSRPDGTRSGEPAFFDWINRGKLSCVVDFDDELLRALLDTADIVIEGSRPAALRRRGLGPEERTGTPGRVWLRLSGHGGSSRVAFGDDAAVAGGLVGRSAAGPVFCGDAIADPLTGLESLLAVADSLRRGGGEIVEVSMAAVAAGYAAVPAGVSDADCDATPPAPPPPGEPAAALGADTAAVVDLIARRRAVSC